jgi:hypothetical protein
MREDGPPGVAGPAALLLSHLPPMHAEKSLPAFRRFQGADGRAKLALADYDELRVAPYWCGHPHCKQPGNPAKKEIETRHNGFSN